jgi:pimeloyl-ACP methyl ester carboxylesterase
MKEILIAGILLFTSSVAQAQTPASDASPHTVRTVATDDGVRLEVLDWGGTGRPLILLAGLGGTAHVFDTFAPGFTARHHVYGITRRGYGASSGPDADATNYDAERLGMDVLAVIDALKIDRPVLAGHSVAGEELTAAANQHPEKIAGLIYLDGANAYAYYAPGNLVPFGANLIMNFREIEASLAAGAANKADIQKMASDLSDLEQDVAAARSTLALLASAAPDRQRPAAVEKSRQQKIRDAVVSGVRKYTLIPVPVLALYAIPKAGENIPPAVRAQIEAQAAQAMLVADRFEKGNPAARVVRLPGASHLIWESNEAEVIREMNMFMDGLK